MESVDSIKAAAQGEPARRTARILSALFLGGLFVLLLIGRFELGAALIRPLAFAFGNPAAAGISAHRESKGGAGAGKYLEINYQYSPDYAPRLEMKVNDAAYAAYTAIAPGSQVAIHYIPGCASCIALDDDYGSSRQRDFLRPISAFFVVCLAIYSTLLKNRE